MTRIGVTLSAIGTVCTFLLFAAAPAAAWDCDVHMGLALLSNVSRYPGAGFVRITDPKLACKQYRKPAAIRAMDCSGTLIGDDLVLGAQDPDAGKSIWRARSHDADAHQRALDAFTASLKQYQAGELCGKDGPSRQLAHAFHYMQDMGDPSKQHLKGALHKADKDLVRRTSNALVQKVIRRQLPSPLATQFGSYLNDARARMAGQNLEGLINSTNRFRLATLENMKVIFDRSRSRPNELDYGLTVELLKSFAVLIAAEDQMIGLFNGEISRLRPRQQTPRQPERYDYPIESTPRPSYR